MMDFEEMRVQKRLDLPQAATESISLILTEIDAIKNDWLATSTRVSPRIISQLTRRNMMKSAGASQRIAGHHFTDKQVANLYENLNNAPYETQEKQEVSGYLECLQTIFNRYQELPVTIDLILQLHNTVQIQCDKSAMQEITPPHFKTTAPYLVKKEIEELIEWYTWANRTNAHHPLILIANFIFEYLAIHPFQDGNGRTSRLLTNLMLLQQEYLFATIVSHDHVIEMREEAYFQTIVQTHKTWKTKTENILPWLLFFLDAIKTQGAQAVKTIGKDNSSVLLPPHHLALLTFAKRRASRPFNRKEVRTALRLSPCMAETLLSKLTTMRHLKKLGHGPTARYQIL